MKTQFLLPTRIYVKITQLICIIFKIGLLFLIFIYEYPHLLKCIAVSFAKYKFS